MQTMLGFCTLAERRQGLVLAPDRFGGELTLGGAAQITPKMLERYSSGRALQMQGTERHVTEPCLTRTRVALLQTVEQRNGLGHIAFAPRQRRGAEQGGDFSARFRSGLGA